MEKSRKHISILLSLIIVICSALLVPISANAVISTQGDYQYTNNLDNNGKVISVNIVGYKGAANVTHLDLPDDINGYPVVSLGYDSLRGLESLKSVSFPKNITEIGYGVFHDCIALVSVAIPDTVTVIREFAFDNCSSLSSVTIGKGVKSLGHFAFAECNSLKSISIPNNVTFLDWGAFSNCQNLEKVTIGNGVTEIADLAFSHCTNLTDVKIGSGLRKVGYMLFNECTSLKSIELPSNVTEIGFESFANCTSLESITLGTNLASIDYNAFEGCTSLKTVYYGGTSAKWNRIYIGKNNSELLKAEIHCAADNRVIYSYSDLVKAVGDNTESSETIETLSTEATTAPESLPETEPAETVTEEAKSSNKTEIIITKRADILYVKGKYTVPVKVTNGKGKTKFKSNNTKVLSVNSKGKLTAKKAGTANITITNNKVSKVLTYTVSKPYLYETHKTLDKGKKYTIQIIGKVGNATFTSANKKVAKVSKSGKITAKSRGTTKITIKTNGNIKLKFNVMVS